MQSEIMIRALLLTLAIASPALAAPAGLPAGVVARVTDGDTFVTQGGEKIRLLGVDAPELRGAECPAERRLAHEATRYVRQLQGRTVRLERHGRDRYGRTLARVWMADGRDLGEVLIERGLAKIWPGRKANFC